MLCNGINMTCMDGRSGPGYYDSDEDPVELKKGYCEIRTEYDEYGAKTERYYDVNGNEVEGK